MSGIGAKGLSVGQQLDWYDPKAQAAAAKAAAAKAAAAKAAAAQPQNLVAKAQGAAARDNRAATAAGARPASRANARQASTAAGAPAPPPAPRPPPPTAVPQSSLPAAPEQAPDDESTWEVAIDDDLLSAVNETSATEQERAAAAAQGAEQRPDSDGAQTNSSAGADADKASAAASEKTETSAAAGSVARALEPLEAARSVEEALKAKEKLAQQSVQSAMLGIAQRKKQLEEEQRKQLERLRQEEEELQKLQAEVKSDGKIPEVEALRVKIEGIGRQMQVVSRDVEAKRVVMQRATEAYAEAEEGLSVLRERKRRMEEEMLDMLLDVGRRRDEKLNAVLTKI